MKRSIVRLMVVVAAVAAVFAVVRAVVLGEGNAALGISMIALCVVTLVQKTYADAVSMRRRQGFPTSWAKKAGLLLTATVLSIGFLLMANLAFLVGSQIGGGFLFSSPMRRPYRLDSAVFGIAAALMVSYPMRRVIWPRVHVPAAPSRLWSRETARCWPFATLVALIVLIGILAYWF